MFDDTSLPEERSIDFKINDFGARNLRQVVPEQEEILLNKVKKHSNEMKLNNNNTNNKKISQTKY